jgi:hypothetical protein
LPDRWGVRTVLVEKHAELSPFPRSRLAGTASRPTAPALAIPIGAS